MIDPHKRRAGARHTGPSEHHTTSDGSLASIKTFVDVRCPTCGNLFQPVDWLAWRARGYCREVCYIKRPPA